MKREEQIREFVAAGDFSRAARAFEEYAAEIRAAIRRGTCTPAVLREAGELVRWSREVTLAARAHLQDQLHEQRARAYVRGVYCAR
jgi:hypothetical protein